MNIQSFSLVLALDHVQYILGNFVQTRLDSPRRRIYWKWCWNWFEAEYALVQNFKLLAVFAIYLKYAYIYIFCTLGRLAKKDYIVRKGYTIHMAYCWWLAACTLFKRLIFPLPGAAAEEIQYKQKNILSKLGMLLLSWRITPIVLRSLHVLVMLCSYMHFS